MDAVVEFGEALEGEGLKIIEVATGEHPGHETVRDLLKPVVKDAITAALSAQSREVAELREKHDMFVLSWGSLLEQIGYTPEVAKRAEVATGSTNASNGIAWWIYQELDQLRADLAAAQKDSAEWRKRYESAYDCHGGPGMSQPTCGGCISCLNNRIESLESDLAAERAKREGGEQNCV